MGDKRFVVQEHTTADGTHWDLMLEQGDILTTFRLEAMPARIRGRKVRAEKIFDHPIRFLTYEGPVQQGTGQVRIADRGTYHILVRSDEMMALELGGEVLQGDFTLTRTHEAIWSFAPTSASTQA